MYRKVSEIQLTHDTFCTHFLYNELMIIFMIVFFPHFRTIISADVVSGVRILYYLC